jgi:hypothetical protein
MIRQINHTGRKRISRDAVRIIVREENRRLTFDATRKLGEYSLPSDAHVWLEAYRQASWMQFSWGRVSEPTLPAERWLDEFDGGDGLRFRVRVTSASESHRILAEADRIPCRSADGKDRSESLLPIRIGDLGNEVWRLELDGDEPTLVVNRSVGDGKALARTPEFAALVYPAVIRAIFTRVLLDENHIPEEDEDGWRGMWLKFARQYLGTDEVPDPKENRRQWIDDAAIAYAQTYSLAERFNEGRKPPEDSL